MMINWQDQKKSIELLKEAYPDTPQIVLEKSYLLWKYAQSCPKKEKHRIYSTLEKIPDKHHLKESDFGEIRVEN